MKELRSYFLELTEKISVSIFLYEIMYMGILVVYEFHFFVTILLISILYLFLELWKFYWLWPEFDTGLELWVSLLQGAGTSQCANHFFTPLSFTPVKAVQILHSQSSVTLISVAVDLCMLSVFVTWTRFWFHVFLVLISLFTFNGIFLCVCGNLLFKGLGFLLFSWQTSVLTDYRIFSLSLMLFIFIFFIK